MPDAEKTVLGRPVAIEGEIETDEALVIQGRIQGKIVYPQDLTVDSAGEVEASIATENLAVGGMLTGNVTAAERVEVGREGKMIGDIRAPRVVIADGAK